MQLKSKINTFRYVNDSSKGSGYTDLNQSHGGLFQSKMTVLTAPERSSKEQQQQLDEEEDGYFTCQVSVHHKVKVPTDISQY
jgi:hypothetical protein